jgi:uncharacterized membrane protein YdjX (TVP38/TMEM64 family)
VSPTKKVLSLLVLLGLGLAIFFFTPAASYLKIEHLNEFRGWLKSFGAWTPFFFILAFLVGSIFCFPATPFTLTAGALYGVGWGIMMAVIGSNLAANATFGLSRWTGFGLFACWFSQKARDRIQALLSKSGIEVVFTLRVLPLFPFGVFNYFAGLSPVRWTDYAIGSLLGMFPSTVIYVSLGSAVFEVSWRDPKSWLHPRVWGPLAIAVAFVVGIRWFQRRANPKQVVKAKEDRYGVKQA